MGASTARTCRCTSFSIPRSNGTPLPTCPTPAPIAATTALRRWTSYFGGDFRADIQEIVDAGDYVVVWCILRGQVRETSGANVELPEAHNWKFREGKVVEVQEYRTKAEALEAVGLTE